MEKTTEELMAMLEEVNVYSGELDNLDYRTMDFLDDALTGYEPSQILNKMHFGDFNPMHDYFRFDAYENLESINEWEFENLLEEWENEIIEAYERIEGEG